MTKEQADKLLLIARKNYIPGVTFKPAHLKNNNSTFLVEDDDIIEWIDSKYEFIMKKKKNSKTGIIDINLAGVSPVIYYAREDKWADIIAYKKPDLEIAREIIYKD